MWQNWALSDDWWLVNWATPNQFQVTSHAISYDTCHWDSRAAALPCLVPPGHTTAPPYPAAYSPAPDCQCTHYPSQLQAVQGQNIRQQQQSHKGLMQRYQIQNRSNWHDHCQVRRLPPLSEDCWGVLPVQRGPGSRALLVVSLLVESHEKYPLC